MKSATGADLPVQFDVTVDYDAEQLREIHKVNAYITVSAQGAAAAHAGPGPDALGDVPLAEVILLDRSGSMNHPPSKLHQAKRAGRAAVDLLRDGTRFAVVAGTHRTYMVYPREHFLAPATARTRAEAMNAIENLDATGEGTVIGDWLEKARELLEPHADAVRHAILLTDGQNQHQARARRSLEQVLDDCRRLFSCDARGIGTDWEPQQLERIAEVLQGTADAVPELGRLEDEFRAMIRTALSRVVPEVALRVRCARGVRLAVIEQDFPVLEDLSGHGLEVAGTSAVDYSMGPWSQEKRQYAATFDVGRELPRPDAIDSIAVIEVVTGQVGTVHATERAAAKRVDVTWVDIPPPHTRIDAYSRRHERDMELRALRREGGRLAKRGDLAGAGEAWGRAVALGTELKNTDALDRLGGVLRIVDAAQGVVELLPGLDRPEMIPRVNRAMMGNVSSSRWSDAGHDDPSEQSAEPGKTCPKCGLISVADARYCETKGCDHEFPAA